MVQNIEKKFLLLIKIYSENQLTRLNSQSCYELYKTFYEILLFINQKFSTSTTTTAITTNTNNNTKNMLLFDINLLSNFNSNNNDNDNNNIDEILSYKNEIFLIILEILNNLSTNDFSFIEDVTNKINKNFELEAITILLHGLEIITKIIPSELLQLFPCTADKYFSFVSFITNAYINNLVFFVNNNSNNNNSSSNSNDINDNFIIEKKIFFGKLVNKLKLFVCSYDSNISRQALQVFFFFNFFNFFLYVVIVCLFFLSSL
jgi:hypothetical protein